MKEDSISFEALNLEWDCSEDKINYEIILSIDKVIMNKINHEAELVFK